ncbi:unnamed protein product, partial [Sphacelaria rigidula]
QHSLPPLPLRNPCSARRSKGKSKQLKFPENVPIAVKTAINNYVPAEGRYIARPNARSPSVIHFWGVRL